MRLQPDLELARRFVSSAGIPGRLLLGGITGSHDYGFPSADSDLDIKAIHVAPAESFLGLAAPRDGHERLETYEGVECDLTSNEVRQALHLLLRGNGNMIERIFCPYQLVESEETEAMRALAKGALSRRFHDHYAGFFRAMCRDVAGAPVPTAKSVLYAHRVALTGIHLLLTGELEADLSVLAAPYGADSVLPLIERKRATIERVALAKGEAAGHLATLERLGGELDRALEASPLPAEPRNAAECEAWLVDLRRREIRG
jgi:uncharacterized protein